MRVVDDQQQSVGNRLAGGPQYRRRLAVVGHLDQVAHRGERDDAVGHRPCHPGRRPAEALARRGRATVVLPAPTGAMTTAPPRSRNRRLDLLGCRLGGAVFQSTGTRRSLGCGRGGRAVLVYVDGVSPDPGREWAVCVYCASGPTAPRTARPGRPCRRRHRRARLDGGVRRRKRLRDGRTGDGARAGGGRTIGVIPKALVHRELADIDADELVVTETMRERKQVMEDRADAFVALPGGIGTLEEFFEAWTAGYLGMHDKPVVMLDPFGHYDGLRAWLYGLIDSGYVTQNALDRLVVVDDVDDAMAACAPAK